MTVRHVDRSGSNTGGFETDRECKAVIGLSASHMSESFLEKHTPQGRCPRRAQFCQGALVNMTRYSDCGCVGNKETLERTNIFLPSISSILLRSRYSARTIPAGHSFPPPTHFGVSVASLRQPTQVTSHFGGRKRSENQAFVQENFAPRCTLTFCLVGLKNERRTQKPVKREYHFL